MAGYRVASGVEICFELSSRSLRDMTEHIDIAAAKTRRGRAQNEEGGWTLALCRPQKGLETFLAGPGDNSNDRANSPVDCNEIQG